MESSLNIAYWELLGDVGSFIGIGRGTRFGDQEWKPRDRIKLDDYVKSGMRRFYNAHDWTFLHPQATLSLASGQSTLRLPSDFGSFENDITVSTSNTSGAWKIQWDNESKIRQLFSAVPNQTGPPRLVAVVPLKGTTADESSRFELLFYPTADQAYTLQGTYSVLPDYLSGAFPYAYGGMTHAETLLESCLAVAEQRNDDGMSVHSALYEQLLAKSIERDSRLRPQNLGYNVDRSDQDRGYYPRRFTATVTYAGSP